MTNYIPIILVEIVIFVLVVVTLTRMIYTIQPGQVGLVFRAGSFRVALRPGFNLVGPTATVRKVKVGAGPNQVLGMAGISETDLGPDVPAGSIKIGERVLRARSISGIRAGTPIRVIEDSDGGIVMVAADRLPTGGRAARR